MYIFECYVKSLIWMKGVGKAPMPYKMAISQNWEIVIWIDNICSWTILFNHGYINVSCRRQKKDCFGEFGDVKGGMLKNADFSRGFAHLGLHLAAVIYIKNVDFGVSSVGGYILIPIPGNSVGNIGIPDNP